MSENYSWAEIYSKKVPVAVWNQVFRDWLAEFPRFKRMGKTKKLIAIYGPVAMGIELIKSYNSSYYPQIIAFNLIEFDDYYLIQQGLIGKRNFQFSVDFNPHIFRYFNEAEYLNQHNLQYKEGCLLVTNQSHFDILGKPTLEQMIDSIFTSNNQDPFIQFFGLKSIIQFSRLLKDKSKAEAIFQKALNQLQSNKYLMSFFPVDGLDIQAWAKSTYELDAKMIQSTVKRNISQPKFKGIPIIDFDDQDSLWQN